MKRAFALLLALCLLLGGAALADTSTITKPSNPSDSPSKDTTINLAVDQAYTVVIPQSVNLAYDATTSTYRATDTVKVTECRLNLGESLRVAITNSANKDTSNAFYIKASGHSVPYSVKVGSNAAVTALPTTGGITVLTCAAGTAAASLPTVALTFSTGANPTFLLAGNYTDTLTFTVSISISQ